VNFSCVGLRLSFAHKSSRQDRLATTIGNSVDPQHPRFWCFSGGFRFFKVDRCWHLIASKELLAFSSALQCLRCCFIWLLPQGAVAEWRPVCLSIPRWEEPVVWERFVRSAPGDVGKQHRAHPGVAARRFPLDHSEPSPASTSRCRNDGARRCTTEKNSDRKHDCPGCTQSGPGTPADISGFGIGSRKRDCRPRRAADYAFS
jgi:hypothetical protein